MNAASASLPVTRRTFVRASAALGLAALEGGGSLWSQAAETQAPPAGSGPGPFTPPPLLTPAEKFRDVSRGTPKPFTLKGEDLIQARLTPETWRLEITADTSPRPDIRETATLGKPLQLPDGTALDLPALTELGRTQGVRFLKAMQCLNIPTPLGQGLWEGVPLREVLKLCGSMRNVRRIYYWGFHNNDPKQLFQSSLSYTEVMETPPGDLPAFIAYRLNGEPISLLRGGPVRMVIPWAHGFKSIKWLQSIVVTNDYRANDTYAEANNDPESHIKTSAYVAEIPRTLPAGRRITVGGLVISGLSGLQRVEYHLGDGSPTAAGDPWVEARLQGPPRDWRTILPEGVSSKTLLGFDRRTGRPLTWPLRYGMTSWSANLGKLKPGKYALRARAVDLNGFAQPEPRPNQKSGVNALELREFEVV
ncbi:MAG: molybdopterin-dependent oxidoreductase [Verrucomicrobiales bacterium]|nr:molybdopterin-dependent oxidoreductase [Verrucomicrobiales bacterium]